MQPVRYSKLFYLVPCHEGRREGHQWDYSRQVMDGTTAGDSYVGVGVPYRMSFIHKSIVEAIDDGQLKTRFERVKLGPIQLLQFTFRHNAFTSM
jgi:hypothetical protein